MTLKKRTLLFVSLLLPIIAAAALFCLFRREEYNKDPDLTAKRPDSALAQSEYRIPTSIEDLTAHADAVIIGAVTADDASDANGRRCALICTEKILAGDIPKEFLLLQTAAGKDRGSIVSAGQRLLLILREQNGYYKTSSDGVFVLDENDRLTSLSPLIICARYDGLHLRTFERDLKESYFYSAIGGSDEEQKALAEQYRNDEAFRQKRLNEWNDLTGGKPLDYEYAVIDSFFD